MSPALPSAPTEGEVLVNPLRREDYVAAAGRSPRPFHRKLPGYEPTPLRDVPALARELGVGRVLVKDESSRLGLPAFKMLGASWATYRALSERLGREPENWATMDDLRAAFAPLSPLTLATATDGNHGRAVARMARLLGFESRVWVPANTVEARIAAIAGEGAEVFVSRGGYDDAVAEAAAAAGGRVLVISDTSWPGYDRIPGWVIEGYTTIFEEVDEALDERGLAPPRAVIVPIGVGAFAASAARHYRRPSQQGAVLVGAEPADAACVLESARARRVVTLPWPQSSIMAGLNCGTPSQLAWPDVSASFDVFVSVTDGDVVEAMRRLYANGITSGESGTAPLAAARALGRDWRERAVGSEGALLLVSTEGVTDPVFYERHVMGA